MRENPIGSSQPADQSQTPLAAWDTPELSVLSVSDNTRNSMVVSASSDGTFFTAS